MRRNIDNIDAKRGTVKIKHLKHGINNHKRRYMCSYQAFIEEFARIIIENRDGSWDGVIIGSRDANQPTNDLPVDQCRCVAGIEG